MKIITDSCCDLTIEYIIDNEIEVLPLTIILNGEESFDDLAITKKHNEYYENIRNGAMPNTSQVNTYQFIEIFEKYSKLQEEVIYIGFSSALSGCINSANIALAQIKDTYKDAKIAIVDSKTVSMGLGLLVYYAVQKIKEGSSWEDVVSYLENIKMKINSLITVDDLGHLLRGGRLSKTASTVGTILGVKPIIVVDTEGKLKSTDKVKGRKKSLKYLADKVRENKIEGETDIIYISHAGCKEEAENLKVLMQKEYRLVDIRINDIGAVIGAHGGPGVIGIFFMGRERNK